MRKHIRILAPLANENFHQNYNLEAFDKKKYDFSFTRIDAGPDTIESKQDSITAVPFILDKVNSIANEAIDSIVIDCFGDPGLAELRQNLTIPVYGAGESGMRQAHLNSQRWSIITVNPNLYDWFMALATNYNTQSNLARIRAINCPVAELENNINKTIEQLFTQACLAVKNDNIDCIVLGCTGLDNCVKVLRVMLKNAGFDIKIINPLDAALIDATNKVSELA